MSSAVEAPKQAVLEMARDLAAVDPVAAVALPIFFLAVGVEAFWGTRTGRDLYEPKDTGVSFLMLFAATLIEIVPKIGIVAVMIWLHEWSPLRDVVDRQVWAWGLLFLLDDLTYYAFHRANHEIRLMWAGHVNHHSSERLHLATALRQGVGERVYKYVFWLPLAALGFDPAMILLMISFSLAYQFWLHTEAVRRFPPIIEAFFNTPSHHRVHHGSNVRYLDRNHAGVLIIWDRLFGTFSAESDEEPIVYGLTKNLNTLNPARVLLHGYTDLWRDIRRAPTVGDKLRYVFYPPGWSHDGPDLRAKTLRAAEGRDAH